MPAAGDVESEALVSNATNLYRRIVELSPHLPKERAESSANVSHSGRLANASAVIQVTRSVPDGLSARWISA